MNKMAFLLSVLMTLILVVAACAPAATPTPTATPTPPPIVATPTPIVATPTPIGATPTPTPGVGTPTPTPTATPSAKFTMSEFGEPGMPISLPPPQYGGIIRLGTASGPSHFDSQRSYSAEVIDKTGLIFDNLIRFSPYMDADNMVSLYHGIDYLSPNLAEKWEVSQDNKIVTFYLKKGVRWHDGKPFTAKDVKYSLDKLLTPGQSVWTGDFVFVDRVEMVDDYTVKIYLKYPVVNLLLVSLAMGQIAIQPAHLKDVSYRTTDFLVGTGAFKFKSYTAGVDMTYEKNPDYRFKGRPYFDGAKWFFFGGGATGTTAAVNSLAAGQIDFINSGGAEDYLAIVNRVAPEMVIRIVDKLGANSNMWVSFVKEGPWQDGRVRKAMTMVLDREAICLANYGKAAPQLCNPKIGYLHPPPLGVGLPYSEYEKAWLLDKPIEVRVAEAKKLLAQAGYPDGFKGTTTASASLGAAVLETTAQWRKHLNIDISPKIIPTAQLMDTLYRGDFDTHSRGSVTFAGAIEQLVSNNYVFGGNSNYGQYQHPLVEELYIKLINEPDRAKQIQIFNQIERFLIQDVPVIPQYIWNHLFMYWPYVKPTIFAHPVWHSQWGGSFTVTWFDKNDPSWAKRAK